MVARQVTPKEWYLAAEAAEKAGNLYDATKLLDLGLAEHPSSADLANSAGSLALRRNEASSASSHFKKASELEPDNLDFKLNLAISLTEIPNYEAALALLHEIEQRARHWARYWSIRANAERSSGRLSAASTSYEQCLSLDDAHVRALHGRARVALERGEPLASQYFDRALARNQGEADLWLGKAQALSAEGDYAGARHVVEQIVSAAPAFLEGLRFLAQLRLAAGEWEFAQHFHMAATAAPNDQNIPKIHAYVLASADRPSEAAEISHAARMRFPDQPAFALAEASYASAAGQTLRAEGIFAELQLDTVDRFVQECRHRLRQRDFDKANFLASQALTHAPDDVSAWALQGLVWRLVGDERAYWMHEQPALVQTRALEGRSTLLERISEALNALHDRSSFPLAQSLRGGTQTPHILFARCEPVFAELHDAIVHTLRSYRSALPPSDETHPLLSYRDKPWRLGGSWSVRLNGGGDHHASHIHPQGIISSALYIQLPEASSRNNKEACLEIGRPPPDLNLELGPLTTIAPEVGELALFPSTLYHGTTPFSEGSRMSVAFDIISSRQPRDD